MAGDTNSSSSANPSLLPATSSRCLTHGITATHDYKVTNFSLLVGIGQVVASSTFSAGGCDWSIRFFPDGYDETPEAEAASFTAVYLCLVAGPAGTRVKFKFTLLDDKGRRVSTRTGKRRKKRKETADLTRTETSTYARAGAMWGTNTFFDRSLLEGLLRDSNDSFTIRCAMSVIQTHTEDDAVIEVPESVLRHDLARMLRDGAGADVTFVVGDRFFRAHRYVLAMVLAARSMVFKAQLFGAMKEAQQGGDVARCVIKVDEMDPAAFAGLLHYIYTDSLADDCTAGRVVAAQHLLVAADRYGLDRLRMLCEARLCGWIDVQSVATTLALAERHQCVKLREACLRFLSWPDMLRAAMKTEGFGHLIASYPSVASDILDKVVSARVDDH
ncbi:BTB/POZ and MATH domain-containing protein 2-like [Miscanthus floridulus]|uniref:BTB/POZ and MATH domain-containing protein 2-like n=1 Tax=Miscanthus floridulus TaxID=154761 RepID=UPI0034591360